MTVSRVSGAFAQLKHESLLLRGVRLILIILPVAKYSVMRSAISNLLPVALIPLLLQ